VKPQTRPILLALSLVLLACPTAHAKMPGGIYVRIIPFANAFNAEWTAGSHNAQDILRMIGELKPDVLNRFTTGMPKMNAKIPIAAGSPPLGFVEFLNAAMKAGAPGCTLTAKIHLNRIWSAEYRMKAAQALHDLPLTPRLHALDLDCYFSKGSGQDHRRALQKFKNMGWTDLGFNFGTRKRTFGYGSYGMAVVTKGAWKIQRSGIGMLKREGIKTRLVHIDYPKAIKQFGKLPPDRQADIITKRICPLQRKWGFRFVYPILYSGYDATKEVTRKDGPYKGATLFQIMKARIQLDRKASAQRRS